MTSAVPCFELHNITKRYPSVVANENVSLTIMPGEIHALLGENGAGKSTLVKIIYGAVKADAGTIRMNGEAVDIDNPAQARQMGIGMVFQHFSLFETLTVAENIALVLDEPFNLPKLSERVKAVSERYGLPLDPDRRVHSLSVGERQCVEIVRCLLQNPQLLILDEPTRGIDVNAKSEFYGLMNEFVAQGGAIIMVSSELPEIIGISDRILVMCEGHVSGELDYTEATEEKIMAFASVKGGMQTA